MKAQVADRYTWCLGADGLPVLPGTRLSLLSRMQNVASLRCSHHRHDKHQLRFAGRGDRLV